MGLTWDGLITADTWLTAHGIWIGVMLSTAAITVVSALSWQSIIDPAGMKRDKLAALTCGSALGAGILVYFLGE